ncbi:hypothetical protein STEG23_036045, partial [Scotinomys teguina]
MKNKAGFLHTIYARFGCMNDQLWSLMYFDTGKGYYGHLPFLPLSEMSKMVLTPGTQVIVAGSCVVTLWGGG